MGNRRSFLKNSCAGLALGLVTPGLAGAGIIEGKKEIAGKELDTLSFDIAVVGAGAAGIPAAIAAARQNPDLQVVLLEEDMIPGGAPVDMFVTFLCGAPRVGIFGRLIRELNRNHSVTGKPSTTFGRFGWDGKNHWWLPSSFMQIQAAMLAEHKNIHVMCGVQVFDVLLSSKGQRNCVNGVRILRNGYVQNIKASVTIDATGTGLISEKAGCKILYGREAKKDFNESIGLDVSDGKVQSCTWMLISQRIQKNAVLPIEKMTVNALESNLDHWVTRKDDLAEMARRDAGIYLQWAATVQCVDTRDPVELGRSQAECLNKLVPAMTTLHEAGFAAHLAPKMGVREVRRVVGEYVLTADDQIKGVFPDDKVADAWYSFDSWGMNLPEEIKHTPPYGIPYRCLIPVGVEGLITSGRIISGTHLASSSYRVQPICSNVGEASGTAAAMAAILKTGIRDIEIKDLQSNLGNAGLFEGMPK